MNTKLALKKARKKLLKKLYLAGAMSTGSARSIGYSSSYKKAPSTWDEMHVVRKLQKTIDYWVRIGFLEKYEHIATDMLRIKK